MMSPCRGLPGLRGYWRYPMLNRRCCFEGLEARLVLSAAVPLLPETMPADLAGRIDQRLYGAFVDVQRGRSNGAVREHAVRIDSANRIDTYVYASGNPSGLVGGLK